jgi:chloride channel protein, CIC family
MPNHKEVGVTAGLGAVGLRALIAAFTWAVTGHSEFGQQGRIPSGHLPWLGPALYVVIPMVGGLLYGPLIDRWSRESRGSGVPEVMYAVARAQGEVRPRVGLVRAPATSLCLATGGSVGREGPIVHIGASLASSLGRGLRRPGDHRRILVACGVAGGISATFNAPVTGVLYSAELILRGERRGARSDSAFRSAGRGGHSHRRTDRRRIHGGQEQD